MILIRIKQLKIAPKNQSKFDVFMQLCYNLNSKLRLASLRGATVEEMQNLFILQYTKGTDLLRFVPFHLLDLTIAPTAVSA